MNTMRIAWKDLKFLLRSRTLLVFSILMPVLMMLMMGYIFPKNPEGNFKGKIGIYSKDLLFTLMIKTSAKDKVIIFKSKEDYINALAENKVNAVVIIPKDFSKKMKSGAEILVVPNPSNPQAGMMMSSMAAAMMSRGFEKSSPSKLHVKIVGIDGGEFNYYEFMAPGIMAMIAIMAVSTGLAASITRERELGTLDGLMVSPISRSSIVVGKIISQMIRGVIQAFIVLGVSILFFGVSIHGSILVTLLLVVLSTFSFVGIGIVITAGIKEQETAQMTMTTITFPMMFFSGVFFPIDQMPKFARYISKIFPLTYAADALRKNIVLGAPLKYLQFDILILVMFAIITSTMAVVSFPKLVKG